MVGLGNSQWPDNSPVADVAATVVADSDCCRSQSAAAVAAFVHVNKWFKKERVSK